MQFNIQLKGLADVQRTIAAAEKQMKFAASVAINNIAKNIEAEQQKEIGGTFDRPKPSTVKATYIKRSTKNDLTAIIGLKDRTKGVPAAEYLHPNVKGGARAYKRSELMLHRAGILPAGMFTVPGAGAKLDNYGNMSRGQINQILSYFRTFGNTALNTKRMNMTDKRRAGMVKRRSDYFVVPVADRQAKLYPGIWQRLGRDDIAPVLLFVDKATYRATYNFGEIAARVVRRTFQAEFDKALEMALRTAK
jgi:hypothetical protein